MARYPEKVDLEEKRMKQKCLETKERGEKRDSAGFPWFL